MYLLGCCRVAEVLAVTVIACMWLYASVRCHVPGTQDWALLVGAL